MTCAVCPNCGLDLQRFEPMTIGDLELQPHEVRWRGNVVRLSPSGRLLVIAVARLRGVPVSLGALSEALGCSEDSDDPNAIIRTQTCFARKAFRSVDPSFSALKTVWGVGVSWAV